MIDIIIPTIDHPKFLDRALTSIENTCTINELMIYVINDNSKYDSKLYEEVIQKHSKLSIGYKVMSENIGPGPARNEGIKMGHGDWICFLDADDIYIDDVVKYCDNQYDFFISNYKAPEYLTFCMHYTDAIAPIHGFGLQRNFIEKYNLYFPNIARGQEDTIFRLGCLMLSSNYKIYDTTYYEFIDNIYSFFSHQPKVKDIFEEQDRKQKGLIGTETWFCNFYNFLTTLKISNDTKISNWNKWLLEGVAAISGYELNLLNQNSLIIIFVILIRYFNYDIISVKPQGAAASISIGFILFLIKEKFLIQQDNLIILYPKANMEKYVDIFNQCEPKLSPIIISLCKISKTQYFDFQSILNLSQYYYKDSFVNK